MKYYLGHVDGNGTVDAYLFWAGPAKGFVERLERSNATWWSREKAARENLSRFVGLVDSPRTFEFQVVDITGALLGHGRPAPAGGGVEDVVQAIAAVAYPEAPRGQCGMDHVYPFTDNLSGPDSGPGRKTTAPGTLCFCGKRRWGGAQQVSNLGGGLDKSLACDQKPELRYVAEDEL